MTHSSLRSSFAAQFRTELMQNIRNSCDWLLQWRTLRSAALFRIIWFHPYYTYCRPGLTTSSTTRNARNPLYFSPHHIDLTLSQPHVSP